MASENQLRRASSTLGYRHSLLVGKAVLAETEEPRRRGHHPRRRRSLAVENLRRAVTSLEAETHPVAVQEACPAKAYTSAGEPSGRDATRNVQPREAV